MTDITRREFLRKTSAGALSVGVGVSLGSLVKQARGETATARKAGGRRRSFSFLHTYEATGRYWRGIQKAGLVRPTTGVRLVHSPFGEDDARRFNAAARMGGDLYKIIERAKCPFVIDRVVGGAAYRAYDFDLKLIDAYASLLGDKFLGGQVHEVLSNVNNDWRRFVTADKKFATQPVRPDELRSYFTWADPQRWTEYGALDDYAGRVRPEGAAALWKEYEWAGKRQAARFGGHYSYAEGSGYGELVWHVFYKWGAAYCIAEVGPWASAQTQFAIAGLRGAAKAAGRPWGVFFAPWGPEGCTAFTPAKDWSWQCGNTTLDGVVSPRGGPSSALQRRIFFHAYLAGADTLHEEWGAEGNLTDWDTGKLSSYGLVTRDLLDFQDAHPDVGEPYTPLALVLDASIPPADAQPWSKLKAALFQYAEADRAAASRAGAGKPEADCYPACAVPEIFDVVPSDAPEEVWAKYKTVINIGQGRAPAGAKAYATAEQPERVLAAARELSPFTRTTHMPMQINRRESDGAWIVALYNPWGAKRGDVYGVGSVLDDGCTIHDVLRPKFAVKSARVIHAWPTATGMKLDGQELQVTVGPGGTLVIEVRC